MSADTEKSELLEAMKSYGYALLEKRRLISVENLERHLKEAFADRLQAYSENLKGRSRTEGENLTDWVKATLTQDKRNAAKIGDWYVWIPCIGSIDGQGEMMRRQDALAAINEIIGQFSDV